MGCDKSGVQLCPPASLNVCLMLGSPSQIQRQVLKILQDAGVRVKAGKGYGTGEVSALRRMEGIKFPVSNQWFWIWALPAPLWLSQDPRISLGSQNILSWKFCSEGRVGKARKPHPKTCLGMKHSWNPLTVRDLLLFRANKAQGKWIFLGVSSCQTLVTPRETKHSWAPLRSEVTTNLCWGGFWRL